MKKVPCIKLVTVFGQNKVVIVICRTESHFETAGLHNCVQDLRGFYAFKNNDYSLEGFQDRKLYCFCAWGVSNDLILKLLNYFFVVDLIGTESSEDQGVCAFYGWHCGYCLEESVVDFLLFFLLLKDFGGSVVLHKQQKNKEAVAEHSIAKQGNFSKEQY